MIYSANITIPALCPIQFREPAETVLYPMSQYYAGKFNASTDFMFLINSTLFADSALLTLAVVNTAGKVIKTYSITKYTLSTGNYYAKCAIALSDFNSHELITFKLYSGSTLLATSVLYESKPRYVKHLAKIEYTNSENDWNTVFGNFAIYVEAGFHPNDFKAEGMKEDFQDQEITNQVIYSQPYETETLSIGGHQGIPNWLYLKINAILLCDGVKVNGETYSQAQGAKLEKIDQTYDGLGRYKIELQKENTYAQ